MKLWTVLQQSDHLIALSRFFPGQAHNRRPSFIPGPSPPKQGTHRTATRLRSTTWEGSRHRSECLQAQTCCFVNVSLGARATPWPPLWLHHLV